MLEEPAKLKIYLKVGCLVFTPGSNTTLGSGLQESLVQWTKFQV